MVNIVDLTVRRFKHGSDLGNFWCLRESGKLIGGHCQVGTWSLVDVVAVNMDKLVIKVALEWPSLRVKLSLSHHKGRLICLALCIVDVPIDMGGTVLLGLPFS